MTTRRKKQRLSDRIACKLTENDLKTQRERWMSVCGDAGTGRIETEDGLRLVFANQPGVADELRELVAVENECCGWAQWTVSLEGDNVLMDARSRGEGPAILRQMFDDKFPAHASTTDR
jgi:hypothetical protein